MYAIYAVALYAVALYAKALFVDDCGGICCVQERDGQAENAEDLHGGLKE
jgi:hypothetical protein